MDKKASLTKEGHKWTYRHVVQTVSWCFNACALHC